MTSPVKLHLIPDCGLQITPKFSEEDNAGRLRQSMQHQGSMRTSTLDYDTAGGINGKQALSYSIENIEAQGFPVKGMNNSINGPRQPQDFVGVMSPLSRLSLPKERKKQAGIKPKATRYAYIHPPKGLAAALDWAYIRVVWKQLKYHKKKMNAASDSDNDDDDDDDDEQEYSMRSSLQTCNLITQKSMSRRLFMRRSPSTDSKKLNEPLVVPASSSVLKKWALACFSLLGAFVYFEDKDDGVEVISVNAICLSELGTQGVLRMAGPYNTPLETIQVLRKLDRFEVIPLENFHEFGFVAMAWVCPKEQGSSNGSVVFLREDNTALTFNVKSGADAVMSGKRSMLADLIDPYELNFKVIMGQGFVTDYVCFNDDERKFLKHFPTFSPLHYSCRFKTNEIESIRSLMKEFNDSIGGLDRFNRSVLHLACESSRVTGEVIRELLNNEDNAVTKRLLYGKTKCCKKLPLHVAICSGAPKCVVEELLKASKTRQTYLEKTAEGRLPIHIAIEKMADKDVIELLLKADTKKETIYEVFKGMLPLHIACWNGHYDAVQVLLKYDEEGRSLHHNVSTATYFKFKTKQDYMTFNKNNEAVVVSFKLKKSKRFSMYDDDDENEEPFVRALHIALLKCADKESAKITKLLLQGEYWNIQSEEGEVTVSMKDSAGRNPLMLACMQNADEEIIKSLINLDETKNTAARVDRLGNTALHHLCEHKSVSASAVQLLLDAEDEYYSRSRSSAREPLPMSTRQKVRSWFGLFNADAYQPLPVDEKSTSKVNSQRMTPLKLAIRSGASTSVLQLLLRHDRIDMRDFDDQTIHQLSMRVSGSTILQESINHKLAARHSCFILITSVVYKVAAFIVFVNESNIYLSKGQYITRVMGLPFLVFYAAFEILKEINELISFGAQYLVSEKNLIDATRIILMVTSLNLFFNPNEKIGAEAYLVIASSLLLGIDIILSLRSTFLPFAKFAGGLTAILFTLVPFFIVSLILIVCFIVAFRVDAIISTEPLDNDGKLCVSGFMPCTWMVFRAFLIGEFESDRVLYLVFGFTIILILLTIIIAIVSDAWDAVENKATEYYWESRITFLHESRSSIFESGRRSLIRKEIVKAGTKLTEWIDEFGYVGLLQDEKKFSWTRDSPYNQVTEIQQYLKPFDFFHPSVAEVIKNGRSFHSDVYWISQNQEGLGRKKSMAMAVIKWFGYYVMYCFFFLLGIPTGGFFWPTGLRRSILSYGYKKSVENETGGISQHMEVQRASTVQIEPMMPNNSNSQQFDEFFVQMMGINTETAQRIDQKAKLQMIGDKIGVKVNFQD